MDISKVPFKPIVRESELSLYMQIVEQMRDLIKMKVFSEEEALPTEMDIAETLGVSRSVVRQAILQLVSEGLLYRVAGKGTFLSYPKMEYDLLGFYNFKSEVERQGQKLSIQMISLKYFPADAINAALFRIVSGESIAEIKRLLLVDGEPLILETTLIPEGRVKGLNEEMVATEAYRDIFEKYHVEISEAKKYLEPRLADPFESKYLGISTGMPVLLIDRYTYGKKTDVVVARCKWTVRGDRCKYYIGVNASI